MDQPGKVAKPARGQLNRENGYFPFFVHTRDGVLRDGFGSLVPCQPAHLHTQAGSGAYLRDSPDFPSGVHLLNKTDIRHRVSSEFIGSRTGVPMVVTAESSPAQGQ